MQEAIPVIGVDVSRDSLSCSVLGGSTCVVLNDEVEINRWLNSLPSGSVVAMESTGRYHQLLARLALQNGMRVYVLNAQDVFFYAKGLGMRGKTDRSDAQVIARYAAEHLEQLHAWCSGSASQQRIEELVRRRAGVTTHRSALRQLLRGIDSMKPHLKQLDAHFELVVSEIDRQIQEELQHDAALRTASALLQTITGIGPVGSALLASLLSRIPFANADALVAYSGLDPRPNDSGQKHGRRRLSKRGPPHLRRQMYLAAFAASHSKALKPLYQSIRAKGFAPTEAMVILGRKLLRVAWAVWKSHKPFAPAVLVGQILE